MVKQILVPIAPGTEELEAITIADILRRAGMQVTMASCCPHKHQQVTASRSVVLVADCLIDDVIEKPFDMIVLPGGLPGAEHLRDSHQLIDKIHSHREQGRWLAAICAAPVVVLQHHKLLGNAQVTCYPSFQAQLPGSQVRKTEPVVIDEIEKLITSQGPATAMAFSLAIVEILSGKEKAEEIAHGLLYSH